MKSDLARTLAATDAAYDRDNEREPGCHVTTRTVRAARRRFAAAFVYTCCGAFDYCRCAPANDGSSDE